MNSPPINWITEKNANIAMTTNQLIPVNQSKVDTIVKTDQSFVHIKHSITIRQYKFWHLILKNFGEQLERGVEPDSDGFYYQSIKEVSDLIGYEVSRLELKKDFESLRVEPIIVNYLEKDGLPAEHFMGFISEYKILSKRIGFRLPSIVQNIIRNKEQNQQMFLLLNWNIFNSFNGKYEAIIYKLCRDYVGVGRTPYFSIDTFREYMGVADNEYKEFKELSRWVIKKPLMQLAKSEQSDIVIEEVYVKEGRAVAGLYFTVKWKHPQIERDESLSDPIFKHCMVEITIKDQQKYLQKFSRDEILASIEKANDYIESLKAKGKDIKYTAIYNKAIMDNWGHAYLEEKALKENEKKEALIKANQAQKEQQQQAIIEADLKKQEEKLLAHFDQLPDETKNEIIMKMINGLKRSKKIFAIHTELYNEHGLNAHVLSPVFRGNLVAAIKKNSNLLGD